MNKGKEEGQMSEQVKHITDSSFEQDVLQSAKPVLVDFWAEWCAPCRMIGPIIDQIASEFASSATVVKLNVDDNTASAQRFGIKGIPTLILFSEGKEVERVVGATSKDAITRIIEKYVSVSAT
ncbi:MAG TPA: thioredoxin [Pyrinomonadaceae bacterium]|nr:thioredoxin [Pyrinomonadaceae bacterium]